LRGFEFVHTEVCQYKSDTARYFAAAPGTTVGRLPALTRRHSS